ncbi:hypothetical protein PPYR_12863 [Photinus pyralis]|uniref:Sulfotransferase domain-containing protein n=1 Tax=Photinus pyralis TaxID=7054 RepID=A0A1Y1LPK0_PHOPY|nr:sulfotransferase 1E1-like [Photinus pyralis]KAB0793243.1 hypothetical protein PPYR_12863 [Photinus pyralis]
MMKVSHVADESIDKIAEEKCKDFSALLFGEDETTMPSAFQNYVSEVENFEILQDDIIVAAFPKSGTTWTQEMVWLIKNRHNLEDSSLNLYQRFPMMEACLLSSLHGRNEEFTLNSIKYLQKIKGQRFIKTHLPFSLLPKDIRCHRKSPKIIYVTRNTKDVFISMYHFHRIMLGYTGDLETFSQLFLNNRVFFAPYWKHVMGYYSQKDLPNFCFLKYEDLKRDLKSEMVKVCRFLEEKPLTDAELTLLCQRLDFNFMKDNEAVNHERYIDVFKRENPQQEGCFMRSGSIGSYKLEMPPEMVSRFDKYIQDNISNTELDDPYWFGP